MDSRRQSRGDVVSFKLFGGSCICHVIYSFPSCKIPAFYLQRLTLSLLPQFFGDLIVLNFRPDEVPRRVYLVAVVSTPILGRDGIGRYHPTCVSGKDKTFVGLRRSSRYARTQDTATNPPLAYLRSAIRQAPSDRQSIGDIWQSTYGQMPQDSPSSERHLCPHGMHLLHAYVLRSTSRQPIVSGCRAGNKQLAKHTIHQRASGNHRSMACGVSSCQWFLVTADATDKSSTVVPSIKP
jgi:hypothetical protein